MWLYKHNKQIFHIIKLSINNKIKTTKTRLWQCTWSGKLITLIKFQKLEHFKIFEHRMARTNPVIFFSCYRHSCSLILMKWNRIDPKQQFFRLKLPKLTYCSYSNYTLESSSCKHNLQTQTFRFTWSVKLCNQKCLDHTDHLSSIWGLVITGSTTDNTRILSEVLFGDTLHACKSEVWIYVVTCEDVDYWDITDSMRHSYLHESKLFLMGPLEDIIRIVPESFLFWRMGFAMWP